MPDQPLIVLEDLPAAVVAGAGHDYGVVNGDIIHRALNLASRAYKRVGDPAVAPDDVASLRQAVNELSDAVRALAGELLQIERGIRHKRIASTPPD